MQQLPAGAWRGQMQPTAGPGSLKLFNPPQIMGPLVMENVAASDLQVLAQNNWQVKRMFRDTIYQRQRYVAGSVVPTNELTLFSTTLGNQMFVVNSTATSFQATQIDTNISQSNQLPKGDIFICTSIQIMLQFVGALDTTITAGEALVPTPVGTPPSVTNNMRCALTGGYVYLTIGSATYETAPIWAFPAGPYGLSGFAGAGISSTSTESFMQNTMGRARECRPWHVIDPGRLFSLKLRWIDAWTPQTLFYMTFMLDGFRLTDVQ